MLSFRERREALLLVDDQDSINYEEFILQYNLNTSKNFDSTYWNYDRIHVDGLTDKDCRSDFDFIKQMCIDFSKY